MSIRIYIIEPTVEHPTTDVYVGSTKNTLGWRFRKHKSALDCSSKILFEKYGVEHCRIRELECCDEENRKIREDHWIKEMKGVNQLAPVFDRVDYARKYQNEHRERIAEHSRKYREENREKRNESSRKYYEENREKRNESCRKYYEVNRERINELQRKYREENKEKLLQRKRELYAAKKISAAIINEQPINLILSTPDTPSED